MALDVLSYLMGHKAGEKSVPQKLAFSAAGTVDGSGNLVIDLPTGTDESQFTNVEAHLNGSTAGADITSWIYRFTGELNAGSQKSNLYYANISQYGQVTMPGVVASASGGITASDGKLTVVNGSADSWFPSGSYNVILWKE